MSSKLVYDHTTPGVSGEIVDRETGIPVILSSAATEDLAEVVDLINEDISKLQEARSRLERELAKRMTKLNENVGAFKLAHFPRVYVTRRHDV